MVVPRSVRSLAANVAVMAVAGWAAAGAPFRGDQALFAVTAREMSGGAVLYRDVWDVAHPGIFWFYQLAGACFGFGEDGIHLFEWVWWTAFVLAVSAVTRGSYGLNRYPLAPAVLIGAVYYLTSCADPSHLTKTEGLAGFPLFLGVWLASRAAELGARSGRWLVAAGAAGGVAVLFKFLFALCLAPAWAYLLVEHVRAGGNRPWRRGAGFVAGLAAGVSLPLGLAVGYFAAVDGLREAYETLFITPREMMRVGHLAGANRLFTSVRWFLEVHTPVLALAVLGAAVRMQTRRDPFVVATGLQFAAAAVVILVQRWSWWGYHFLLMAVPAGVVAAYTWPAVGRALADRLGRPPTRAEVATLAVPAAVLFLPALGHGAVCYLRLAGHRLGWTEHDRREARLSAGRAYREAVEETAWLACARPGPIFVAGDPLFYWLSGRRQATAVHGWSLELYSPDVWARLAAEVEQTRPGYVFVARAEHHYDAVVRDRGAALADVLARHYRPIRESDRGVWYELAAEP